MIQNLFFLFFCPIFINGFENDIKAEKLSTIRIEVSNIRSANGSLQLGIFRNESEFKSEKPFKSIVISKKDISNNTLSYSFNLEEGVWGISLLDDENNNQKMDYNLLNMPKEGFGFSNFYLSGFKRPVFSDFSFTLNKNEYKHITTKIRYL